MLLTVGLLKSKETKQAVQQNAEEINLNKEIKEILNKVKGIIEPGITEGSLKYAFFVETRKKVSDSDTTNIYSITSDEGADNPSDIKLDENGLIYNMLNGLLDSDSENVQTLIAGVKLNDGRIISFKDTYYVTQTTQNFKTSLTH